MNNIFRYTCGYDVFKCYADLDFLKGLDDDDRCFLQHYDDYEPLCLCVIDGEKVVTADSISGDVVGSEMPLDEFISQIMDLIREDREARA